MTVRFGEWLLEVAVAVLALGVAVVDVAERKGSMEAAFRETDRVPVKERLLFRTWTVYLDGRIEEAEQFLRPFAAAVLSRDWPITEAPPGIRPGWR